MLSCRGSSFNPILQQLRGAKFTLENGQVFLCDVHSRERKRQTVLLVNLVQEPIGIRLRSNFDRVGKAGELCPARYSAYGGCIPMILHALEELRDVNEALTPWEGNLGNKERTIVLKEQNNWERAFEIFNWFKGKGCYEINVIHYNIVLGLLGRAKQWDLLWSLWDEMQSKGIMPTNATYATLINAYSKGGLKREALMWLGEMYKRGVKPDEVTMGTIVQAYKKAGDYLKAEDFFKRWSLVMGYAPQGKKSYSLYTYNTLIDTYGKAGLLKEAFNTFAQMLSEGIVPDTVTLNTMIHICGSHGRFEEVVSFLEMMDELRCSPDTRTYNILISLYTQIDDIGMATNYFSKMKEAGLVPDFVSYRTLLYAFAIRCMVEHAESLVMEMELQALEIDEYTQTALTRMYVKAGMLEQSWAWFEKFCDKMSSECYSANIDAFGEQGILFLAEKAFTCCTERHKLSVLVFNVMIKAYGVNEKYDKACDMFNIMKDYGIFPDKCTYISLVQILSDAGLLCKALIYVRRMQEAGLVSDCVPYSMVISGFTKLGEVKMAVELFNEMINFGFHPDIVVYSVLINAFAEVGFTHEAIACVESMKHEGLAPNSIICNSLIKLYTRVGHLHEAEQIYHLAKTLEGGPHPYSSNCMIHLYCENVMVCEAEEIFHCLKLNGDANEFSYAMMLCLYKKMGRFAEAYKIARDMQDLGLVSDAFSYNNMICLFASDGRLKETLETFQQMLAKGLQPGDATFKALGVVMLKRGASKEAIKQLEKSSQKDSQGTCHEWVKALSDMARLDGVFHWF